MKNQQLPDKCKPDKNILVPPYVFLTEGFNPAKCDRLNSAAQKEYEVMKKSKMAVHFSSNTDEWQTPPDLFARLDAQYHFTLDPCCTKTSAKCAKYFTAEDDGLTQSWAGHRVFCNPPYSRGKQYKWIKKAYEESLKGVLVVCLIPARTDVKFFYDYCTKASEIIFITGRVKFIENGKTNGNNAPFPSCIVVFSPTTTPLKISWKKLIDL